MDLCSPQIWFFKCPPNTPNARTISPRSMDRENLLNHENLSRRLSDFAGAIGSAEAAMVEINFRSSERCRMALKLRPHWNFSLIFQPAQRLLPKVDLFYTWCCVYARFDWIWKKYGSDFSPIPPVIFAEKEISPKSCLDFPPKPAQLRQTHIRISVCRHACDSPPVSK